MAKSDAVTTRSVVERLIDLAIKAGKSELCCTFHMEGDDRVCNQHGWQWNEPDAVCNGIQGSLHELEREY